METKGREELDLPQKLERLREWCEDATAADASDKGTKYDFVFVDQKSFERDRPDTFQSLAASFLKHRTQVVEELSKEQGTMGKSSKKNGDGSKTLSRQERIDRACELYAAGKLSRGPAARLAGLNRFDFDEELYQRKIPSYTPDMLEQDLAVVREEPPK